MVGYFHEILFSGAISSVFLTCLIQSGNTYWTGQFFGWYVGLNAALNRRTNDSLGITLAACIWSLALALIIFLFLRVFSRLFPATRMFLIFAGVLVVAAPPACLWIVELQSIGLV